MRVKVRGAKLNLSDQDRTDLETQIQRMVTLEVIKHEQARLQIAKESTSLRKRAFNVALEGLHLPEEDAKRIESNILQIAKEKLGSKLEDLEGEVVACFCGPLEPCCDPPGTRVAAGCGPLPPYPPGQNYLLVILAVNREDILLMRVEEGTSLGLGPNQMRVGLRSDTDWAKEIQAWAVCLCAVSTLRQDRANDNPVWMDLTQDSTYTLVFRKPKFLGVWTDMFHFDHDWFWTNLGGKIITFTWRCDSCYLSDTGGLTNICAS